MAKNGEKESSPVADQPAGQGAGFGALGEIDHEDKQAEDDAQNVGAFNLDQYVQEESKSRCGKIFSPENLVSKNKVDQLRPFRDEVARRQTSPKENDLEEFREREIDRELLEKRNAIQSSQAATSTNILSSYAQNALPPGVQRLLRHLKKARLEQVQHQGGDGGLAGQPQHHAGAGHGENAGARSGRRPKQGDYQGAPASLKMDDFNSPKRVSDGRQPGQVQTVKNTNPGGVGEPLGRKYHEAAQQIKKLSFADQVTRRAREQVLSPKGKQKMPSFYQYRVKDDLVVTRPRSVQFSTLKRQFNLNSSSTSQVMPLRYQEDSKTYPKAFRDQLQKIRAEKMVGRNNYFKTSDAKLDGNNSSSLMQNEDGPNEAQPRPPGTAVSNSERKQAMKGLGNTGRRRRGTADIWTQNPRQNTRFNGKSQRKKGTDQEITDQDYAAAEPDNRSHKIARFCNTMKVYQQFCSITGEEPHQCNADASTFNNSSSGQGADPTKSAAKLCLSFANYSKRKGISDGEYSANEERFCMGQTSQLNLSTKRLQLGKYAGRDAKSSTSDNFTAPLSGLFYDHSDNYDLLTRNASGKYTTPSFHSEQVWGSMKQKKQYGKFRLTREQLGKIDFGNLSKKLKSVKPRKGKAQRRQTNEEDNEFFMQLVVAPHMARQNEDAQSNPQSKINQMGQL